MSFNINRKKTGSINDGGRDLKVGRHAYQITGSALLPIKSDPTGKKKHVVIDLLNGESYTCKVFLDVLSTQDVRREIAEKTLVAFADATGIGGDLKPERLKSFIGKTVVIETVATQGKGEKKDQTFVNIRSVEPYTDEEEAGEEEEEESAEEEESDDAEEGEEEESEEEEAEEEEEEEETPPPPVVKKKKAAPAAAAPPAKKTRPW